MGHNFLDIQYHHSKGNAVTFHHGLYHTKKHKSGSSIRIMVSSDCEEETVLPKSGVSDEYQGSTSGRGYNTPPNLEFHRQFSRIKA